jgi:HlyD family secretion protein
MQISAPFPGRSMASGARPRLTLLLILLLMLGLAGYTWLQLTRPPSLDSRAVAAQRGTIGETITTSGTTVYSRQARLNFETNGRIAQVQVKLGDRVPAGAPLVTLDRRPFELALEKSRSTLRSAELKVLDLERGVSGEAMASARASIEQAEAKLAQVSAGGRAEDIAAAQAQLVRSEARVQQVAAGARPADAAALQAEVEQAVAAANQVEAQLQAAQATLIESTQRREQARAGQGGPGVRAEDIAQAQVTLETNRIKLAQIRSPRPEDVQAAEANLFSARADLEAALNDREACGKVRTTSNSSSRSNSRDALGQRSSTRSEDRSTSRESCPDARRDALAAKVEAARGQVANRQALLEKQRNPSVYDVRQAELAVVTADANLQKLKSGGADDLASLELKVAQDAAELDRLGASLAEAVATVNASQARLEAAIQPDPDEIRQAQAEVGEARARLAKTANPDSTEVEHARTGVDLARAEYDVTAARIKDTDLALAVEEARTAELSVRQAELDLENAVLSAPFDGVVAALNAHVGEPAGPDAPTYDLSTQQGALVSLVDPRELRVEASIAEFDLGKLAVGRPVGVAFDARPDASYSGRVTAISPSGSNQGGVVKYLVAVQVDLPPEVDLPAGMTTSLRLEKPNALLVPRSAVRRQGAEQRVEVLVDGQTQSRAIRTGLASGQFVEVLDGLVEGETVLLPTGAADQPNGGTG